MVLKYRCRLHEQPTDRGTMRLWIELLGSLLYWDCNCSPHELSGTWNIQILKQSRSKKFISEQICECLVLRWYLLYAWVEWSRLFICLIHLIRSRTASSCSFFQKWPIFLHKYATCPKLPSNISNKIMAWKHKSIFWRRKKYFIKFISKTLDQTTQYKSSYGPFQRE